MYVAIILIHVLLAISLIALVLLQRGKGAEAGAAFGGGASQTVLGSQGASKTLARLTAVLAALFFATSLGIAWLVDSGNESQSGIPDASVIEQQRSSAPSLDDGDDAPRAPANQQGSGSDAEGLTVPSTDDNSGN
ncbi:preprotein translocase subunit SecG [Kushneria indalinina]|uniref:Protein-export membrane protein SecG n=1 Tax=Kushneria indalinina DSM 14324 TaxID=1122140 RepID=A0A3D9DRR5_9GAMM|nr:preprotein translocase subunit SecG [Kushneria indalinina]REC93458.1 protein translocase subunit secG [Kushneria indalinina DSM 14324]